jgi:hypothetical protein
MSSAVAVEARPGIEQLHRLDLLPQLKDSIEVGSVSSYDRTGGNDDGFSGKYSFLAKEDGGLVIADLPGPGVIYRIWTPTPSDDLVEFFFDGEKEPRIQVPMRAIFSGQSAPFELPLVGRGAGGFYSYVPLPYRTSCKIRVRAERVQFYQINFARYADESAVATWQPTASDADRAAFQRAAAIFAAAGSDISAAVTPGGAAVTRHTTRATLTPGETATLFATQEGGRIVGIHLSPSAALASKQRDLLLRIRWDDAAQPAVLCPVGDFFGYAWGRPATTSLLLGTRGDVDYCYFPMPFERAAQIELVSEAQSGPPVEVSAEVLFAPVPRTSDEGKFYAVWRRENPTQKGRPFTFVETRGRGHLVGCLLQAQGLVSGNTYFFEGDDQTTLDGKLAMHGTGSEDFFNGGWYDVPGRWEKRLSFPLSGCLAYQKHLGRTGGYRLMIGDAFAFRESILHTIEHAPTGNELLTDYCGVSFLYLQEPPSYDNALPADRRVVDFTKFEFTPGWSVPVHAFSLRNAALSKHEEQVGADRVSYLSLRATGDDMFGSHFVSLACDIPAAGRYRVSIVAMQGPEQARVQLFENESPQGPPVDFYAAHRGRAEPAVVGTLNCDEGPTHIMFKLIGKNDAASGLGFDLVSLQFERAD